MVTVTGGKGGKKTKTKGERCGCKWVVPALLALLFALTLALRMYPLLHGEFLGPDSFYHASVVRNARETGRFTNHNPLARCPFGLEEGPPRGMYLAPWLLSFLFPVKTAMVLTVLGFALFSVIAGYVLVRRLFSTEVALVSVFLFTVCFGFIQRSAALTFRGELFALPFFFLALYWAVGIFEHGDRRWKDAILSGCMLGLTSMFWNGFVVLVVMYWLAVLPAILVKWMHVKKEKVSHGSKACRAALRRVIRTYTKPALRALIVSLTLFLLFWMFTPQVVLAGFSLIKSQLPLIALAALLAVWAAKHLTGFISSPLVKKIPVMKQEMMRMSKRCKAGWLRCASNTAGLALIALFASCLLFALSPVLAPQAGMGGLFLRWSWLPCFGLAVLLAGWVANWKRSIPIPERLAALASNTIVHWLAILVLVAVLIAWLVGGRALFSMPSIDRLLGSGEELFSTISEFQPLSFDDVWRDFGLLFILALPAVPLLALRFDERRALLAGWLVTSAALMLCFRRFTFLTSLPLMALIALLAVEFIRSRRLLALLVAVVVVLSGAHCLEQSSRFLIPMSTKQFVDILTSIPENLAADACIVSMWDISSLVQWHANLPTYTSSAGGQDLDRIERTTTFFLDKWEFYPGDRSGEGNATFYFLLRDEDLSRVLALNRLSYVGDIGVARLENVEEGKLGDLTIYRIDERFYVGVSENETEAVYIEPEGDSVSPLSLFIVRDEGVYQAISEGAIGCLYIGRASEAGQELYYFNQEFCDSNLAKMLTLRPVGDLRPLLSEDGTILYGPESE